MEVALQINGRQQQQIGKYQISRSGLVLGRGWDCDVIITDSRADAQHARLHLTDDGLLALEDLDSINGTRSAGHQINNGIVASGDIITIGRTKVQIFSADHPVVPARSPSFYDTAKDVLGTPKWAVISTLAALAIILWFNSLERIREIKPEVMFGEVLGIAVSAVAFALFWSAVGKLLRGESQLLANWSITALWVAVGAVSGDLSQWISFNAQSLTVQIWVEALIQFSILFAILLMMLSINTNLGRHTRFLLAFIPPAVMLVTGTILPELKEDKPVNRPPSMVISRPPSLMIGSGESVDQFILDSQQLFDNTAQQSQANDEESQEN